MDEPEFQIEEKEDYFAGSFHCMASPCSIFVDGLNRELANFLTDIAAREATRIEKKFSRYRQDNIIHTINSSNGKTIKLDPETCLLIDFAQNCYDMSDGLFDITSGILRRVWKFDGSDNIPNKTDVEELLPLLGWHKVHWDSPFLSVPPGMELDLGGIGKEYAVDKTLLLLNNYTEKSILVNFGGDLSASGARENGTPWLIGIEKPDVSGSAGGYIHLSRGALTTSGDSRRFLKKGGVTYSHVLDPRTGWPVSNAPRSVTVAANHCTEAGLLSTLAMLKGADAESFLKAQDAKFWCRR